MLTIYFVTLLGAIAAQVSPSSERCCGCICGFGAGTHGGYFPPQLRWAAICALQTGLKDCSRLPLVLWVQALYGQRSGKRGNSLSDEALHRQ